MNSHFVRKSVIYTLFLENFLQIPMVNFIILNCNEALIGRSRSLHVRYVTTTSQCLGRTQSMNPDRLKHRLHYDATAIALR